MKNTFPVIPKDEAVIFHGFPGIAILAVSLLVSYHVGADFGGDNIVRWGTLVICGFLLWPIYLTLQYTLQEMGCLLLDGLFPDRMKTVPSMDSSKKSHETEVVLGRNDSPKSEKQEKAPDLDFPALESATIPTEPANYQLCRDEYSRAQSEKKAAVMAAVMENTTIGR